MTEIPRLARNDPPATTTAGDLSGFNTRLELLPALLMSAAITACVCACYDLTTFSLSSKPTLITQSMAMRGCQS